MAEEKQLTEQESLQLIQQMINKAKGSYHDTGIGPILWGSVITFCSLVTFAEIQFKFKLPFDIWLLTLIAIIPQVFISIRESRMRKVLKYEEVALGYIWTCFGISIFLLIHINAGIVSHLDPIFTDYNTLKGPHEITFDYSSYSTSLFLMLYGMPSILTGGITHFKPMLYGGILCWICCAVSVYTNVKTDLLLMALSAMVMWLIPGIILRRKYLKGTTECSKN
ncbi:MAG: hypothetical protein ABI921_09495 [Panacibacter sp.]